MRNELHYYLDEEIPPLKGQKGIKRYLTMFKIMRYYPSYHAIFLLRYCYVYQSAKGFHKYLRMHYNRLLISKYGIYFNIDENGTIGRGLVLPHPTSIVFGSGINMGENCVVYQNVTFGAKAINQGEGIRYPQIGNDCVFYAGAVIVGGVYVADGTRVGANAVLLTDTEESSIYAGVPATRKR